MPVDGSDCSPLAWPQERLRNICILAHVDHGKTTCADNLISSNGIISKHSAGKIRYLDSRIDEQERQITMKSSAIALRYASPAGDAYLVNLIDSPGHVDFSVEVSMAARLADGAIVVVDVVEGVEAQTRTVLRQAWRDRVKTCLFLNKVDRLIVELEMTPLDAYDHLLKIVEQVNAVNQQLLSEEVMATRTVGEQRASAEAQAAEGVDLSAAWEEVDATQQALCYSPERGNVAFGSATHCWAFRLDTFANMIAGKMGAKPESLRRVLWGEWSFNKKTKRAQRRLPGDTKSKPMFVEFILQQLWTVYNAAFRNIDVDVLKKVQASIPAWQGIDIDGLTAGTAAIRELFSRWLPFERSVLSMITQHLPSPLEAAADRLPVICPRWFAAGSSSALAQSPIAAGLRTSDATAAAVVYMAKFLAADLERLVLTGDALVGDQDVTFVGICRVFAGTIRAGSDIFVMREDATEEDAAARQRTLRVERVFSLMGRFMNEQLEAQAGTIAAVQITDLAGGMELGVERCLTLCDSVEGPCLETPYSSQAFAIVRVSLEPQNVADLNALARGLRLLHRADPSVSVEAMVTGENVLGCCGDEHLKRCISDLQKLYAKDVPLHISTPLVAIRESFVESVPAERLDPKASPLFLPSWASHLLDASTEASSVVSAPASEPEGAQSDPGAEKPSQQDRLSMSTAGVMSVWTANRKACVRIAAAALPAEVLEWMDQCAEELETVIHRQRSSVALTSGREATLSECLVEVERQFEERLASETGGGCTGRLCGMNVAKGGRAVLLDATGSGWSLVDGDQAAVGSADTDAASQQVPVWARPSVLSGFRMAANAGPLCEEPMRGIALVIHAFRQQSGVEDATGAEGGSGEVAPGGVLASVDAYGPMSGQVMAAMKEACRYSLFRRGFARISEVMLAVDVQCEQETLGKVYGVLGKRRAKVLDEGLRDGTSLFYIRSHLPLADSFGLAQDLRQAASGNVSLHCAFSHWEQSEEDPFQEASLTAEELEDLGDGPLPPNNARKLVDAIRKRKGLPTDEKVVSCATNQRTLARKK